MKLLIGVSGGIAAYKACELVSQAQKQAHEVRVMMTESGTQFVGPLTFEGLTEHSVLTDTFSTALAHIEWAKWPDVVCIAPLTANTLAKIACGIADDALTTVVCAVPRSVPIVLAPAMNTEMWLNPVTIRNIAWINDLQRYTFVEPIEKRLACGDIGPGALADPKQILAACEKVFGCTKNR